MPRVAPARTGTSTWRDIVVIHRLEYPLPVTYLVYAAWGACFAVGEVRELADAAVLLAIVANALIILGGLALNVSVDVGTDERHRDKNYLARAVRRFGHGRTLRWVATEMAAGFTSAVAVSLWTGRWIIAGIATVTIALHLLYNIEPARMKRRGFAGSAVFGTALVAMPGLLSYYAVQPGLPGYLWLVVAGAGVLAVGRTAWWSVPDEVADSTSGVVSPVVRHGATRTLALSCLILLAGLGLLSVGLWARYGLVWALVGAAAHVVFLLGVLAVLLRRSTRRASVYDRALPSAVRMRSRALPTAVIGDVVLAVLPLIAR